jgi:hypothetical protein
MQWILGHTFDRNNRSYRLGAPHQGVDLIFFVGKKIIDQGNEATEIKLVIES